MQWSLAYAVRSLYQVCGGSIDEVKALVEFAVHLQLAELQDGCIRLTRGGEVVGRAAQKGDPKPLGMSLIRGGCFFDQASQLIEAGRIAETGDLACDKRVAQGVAPQLLGMLSWWNLPSEGSDLIVPSDLLQELNTIWALLPPPEAPPWAIERKEVGNRAEMYTVQFERSRSGEPSKIHWVARDSDDLGWDVEDQSVIPWRRIEVKGRRDGEVTFYLSQNEWEKAHEFGEDYELQFWGQIDLRRDPMKEYASLRSEGYPLCYPNFAAEVESSDWTKTPTSWRISQLSA